ELDGMAAAGRDVAGQLRAVLLDRVQVKELAVGDEYEETPGSILETLDKVADGGQELRARAKIRGALEGIGFRLLRRQIADHFDVLAVRPHRPVDAGGAVVRVDLARQVSAKLLG